MFANPAQTQAAGPRASDRGRLASLSPLIVVATLVSTPAYAQAAAPGADGGPLGSFFPFIILVAMFALMYVLMIRPQQKRAKQHQAMVSALKRGDSVVLSNGMVGKVTRVEDAEAMVEIATGVNTRVIKSMIAEVRTRGEPVANDAKS